MSLNFLRHQRSNSPMSGVLSLNRGDTPDAISKENVMEQPTTIHFEVPRPLSKEEMETIRLAIVKVAGEVKKVAYPERGKRVEKANRDV